MTLMRAFSKVREKGEVLIPANVRVAVGVKPGQILEFKVVGASKEKKIMISKRENTR